VPAVSAQFGLPHEPCAGCLTVLHELSAADRALSMAKLEEALRSLELRDVDISCPSCGEVHDLQALAGLLPDDQDDDIGSCLEHAEAAVAALVSYGAAVALGVAYAEQAAADERVIAVSFASSIGPEGAPAWREWAERPGFGVYARMWLAEQGEQVAEHPSDHGWLLVEAVSVADVGVADGLASLAVGTVLGDATTTEAAEALSLMRDSGHPDAARFIESVADVTGIRPGNPRPRRPARPGGNVYQLKIMLRNVSKPPVWRRVTVPSGMTLDLMHEVIQSAMGWDDEHLHVFSTPGRDYGAPDPELGHADERQVMLGDVLAKGGDKLRYTYDFGDDWEHDVVLEDILPPGAGSARPSCLAGKGACPPEDCGGAWGYAGLKEILADPAHEQHEDMLDGLGLDSPADFDPAEFRLDQINARLSLLA
jgi:Plasmid pRiA4b ORF-3-like protein